MFSAFASSLKGTGCQPCHVTFVCLHATDPEHTSFVEWKEVPNASFPTRFMNLFGLLRTLGAIENTSVYVLISAVFRSSRHT